MNRFRLIYSKDIVAFTRYYETIEECYAMYKRYEEKGYHCSIYEYTDTGCKIVFAKELGINHLSQYMEDT